MYNGKYQNFEKVIKIMLLLKEACYSYPVPQRCESKSSEGQNRASQNSIVEEEKPENLNKVYVVVAVHVHIHILKQFYTWGRQIDKFIDLR